MYASYFKVPRKIACLITTVYPIEDIGETQLSRRGTTVKVFYHDLYGIDIIILAFGIP